MRELFVNQLVKETLGPYDGIDEKVKEEPWRKYVTGVLSPIKKKKNEDRSNMEVIEIPEIPEVDNPEEDFLDKDVSDSFFVSPILDPKQKPHSMGLSFYIKNTKSDNNLFTYCATWAFYEKKEHSDFWERKPVYYIGNSNNSIYLTKDGKQSKKDKADILVKIVTKDLSTTKLRNMFFVTIYFVNISSFDQHKNNYFFQPQIRIKLSNETKLSAFDTSLFGDDEENKLLSFLYRNKVVKAKGHLCSAIWKDIDFQQGKSRDIHLDYEECIKDIPFEWIDGKTLLVDELTEEYQLFKNCDVRSEFIPINLLNSPKFSWNEEVGDTPELSSEKLSEMYSPKDVGKCLRPLVEGYNKWINNFYNMIKDEFSGLKDSEKYTQIIKKIVDLNIKAVKRIEKGIEKLKNEQDVRLSFAFAMKAMDLQKRWSDKKSNSEGLTWRPFQIAFILMTLESLSNPESEDREVCDLLWIPTGGGKTEAYLGIAAFIMAYRRRKAISSGIDIEFAGAGTSVISRYTLRLLTIQQYRRALKMVTACEYLRVYKTSSGKLGWIPSKYRINENYFWGRMPLEIGLWVGGKVTPNHYKDLRESLERKTDLDCEAAQILQCPVCGSLLSIPRDTINSSFEKGLEKDKLHNIYYVITHQNQGKPDITAKELCNSSIDVTDVSFSELPERNHWLMKVKISSNKTITSKIIDKWWDEVKKGKRIEIKSFCASNPGYFPRGKKDFEIFCFNPLCDLNNLDGTFEYDENEGNEKKFNAGRTHIPALTVDDQIYSRCPSMLIATIDKFARLPFEPKAAAIFGNVTSGTIEKGFSRGKKKQSHLPLDSPNLIIQDELHLIEGPLGSMAGLYEFAIDFLTSEKTGKKIKYLASSATISNSESQVKSLFDRSTFIFPPPGYDAENNFFLRKNSESIFNDDCSGRLYIGLLAPGVGPHTPIANIWTSMLNAQTLVKKKSNGKNKYIEKKLDNYSTITGYFNAKRELAGAFTLYKQDIPEKYKKSNPEDFSDGFFSFVELSSRRSSTELPSILKELNRSYPENIRALFATSMFGTGVDIKRLSLMLVNGQPKTSSSYIQATGRVGRNKGAIVATFYKASRPRDLNHFEFFTGYHRQLYKFVEPVTVMPFSTNAVYLAAGPVFVSVLRNMINTGSHNWIDNPALMADYQNNPESFPEIKRILDSLKERIERQPEMGRFVSGTLTFLNKKICEWCDLAYESTQKGKKLNYKSYDNYNKRAKKIVYLILGDLQQSNDSDRRVLFKEAPQSLREVEGTFSIEIRG